MEVEGFWKVHEDLEYYITPGCYQKRNQALVEGKERFLYSI